MLRRVLARAPFPAVPSVVSTASLTSHKAMEKLKEAPTATFYTPAEVAAQDAGVAVPRGFKGTAGQVEHSERDGAVKLFAGLGDKATVRDYRTAITNAVRQAKKMEASSIVIVPPSANITTEPDVFHPAQPVGAADVVEKTTVFAVTAAYNYDRLHSQPAPSKGKRGGAKPKTASLAASPKPAIELLISSAQKQAIESGSIIGHCVNDARNLGNLREDEGIPQFYVEWAKKYIVPEGVKIRKILKGDQIRQAGLELLYNVGKGSVHEPYVLIMEYVGNKRAKHSTAIVGKGVTFDCGGLNVKPYGSMETMHTDMMGAGTTLATLKAAAQLGLPVNLVGAVGLVENAIGPDSYHPSSILTSLKGTTVEVLNTDAEGRLVLADVLTYVQKHAKLEKTPSTIIDLATLTGAIIVSLGSRRAGLFSNQLELQDKLMTAGAHAGEELWPMPVGPEHVTMMKGGIADLVNSAAGRQAGSCTAAAFLSHFVEPGINWAHLDIAGTADVGDKPKGFEPAGVTGYGVQLLIDYLRKK